MHQNYLGSEWYEPISQEPFWSTTWFLASMCALDLSLEVFAALDKVGQHDKP